MERKETLSQVEEIFREILSDTQITIKDDMTTKDLEGWNSLTNIQLVVAIEKKYQIKFSLTEIVNWENIGAIIDCIIFKLLNDNVKNN